MLHRQVKPSTPSTAERRGAAVRRDSTKKRIPAARKATQILLENFSSARTTKGWNRAMMRKVARPVHRPIVCMGNPPLAKMVGIFVPLEEIVCGCRGKNAKNFWRSKAKI